MPSSVHEIKIQKMPNFRKFQIVLTTSLQRLNIVFSLSGIFDLSISEIPKFGQKVLNLGKFFGIFDEILPKFIPLKFQSSLEGIEKVQTLTISTVSTFCH